MHHASSSISRRDFLAAAVAAGTAVPVVDAFSRSAQAAPRKKSPNERLNLAVVGLGGQGLYDLRETSSENIVALCDVDAKHLDRAAEKHPHAKKIRRLPPRARSRQPRRCRRRHARFRARDRRGRRPASPAARL